MRHLVAGMIPAPPVDPPTYASIMAAAEADLLRAAQVVIALQDYGSILITDECLALFPKLSTVDLEVIAREVRPCRDVKTWRDPAAGGIRIQVIR